MSRVLGVALALLLLVFASLFAVADPEEAGNIVVAEGGNVTPLQIGVAGSSGSGSGRWQGYYGNVTGGVRLTDANNNSLYAWGLADPEGEVYASNGSTVTWSNIDCVNFSTNTSVLRYNVSELNAFVGLADNQQGESDSMNATFNQTFGDDGDSFVVGTKTIDNAENCSMVTLNNGTGYQTTRYKEVLLTDNLSIVFAALMYQNSIGFNNESLDFQMIVGVNNTGPRNYYFFVELS